ncbi:MAG: porin family protein [Campylobacterales bacterium]|nr:porin family protein [Campylobacterales bacterium]
MKKLTLSIATVVAMSSFAVAGGDIEPIVEPVVAAVVTEDSSAGFYVGIAYTYGMETDAVAYRMGVGRTVVDDVTWEVAGMVMAGYQINKYFGVEARYTASLDDAKYNDTDVTYDLTNAAIYAKVMYPVADIVTVYGLVGYGQTTIDDNGVDVETDGLQWGIGAAYNVNDNLSVFVDYTKLAMIDEIDRGGVTFTGLADDFDVSTINVGISYKF